ncbi:MAG: SpoIIE family protein phosphatase [Opitutales bacterium]
MDFHGQRLNVPADLAQLDGLREAFGAFLLGAGVSAEDVAGWQLVFTEAVVNAVVHGSASDAGHQVEVVWSAGDGGVRLEVADRGSGPPAAEAVSLPDDPLQGDGRGLFLIQEFCDEVEQWRGPAGFRLVMTRATPGARAQADAPDALLESALAEISQCYESLAGFYRLGDALIAAEHLPDFFAKTVGDIVKVVPHDRISLRFGPAVQAGLRAELAKLPYASMEIAPGGIVERAISLGREMVWEDAVEIAGDPNWDGYACGVCVPLRAGGVTLGTLALGRRRHPYLVAAELSTVRTYADLFGIALANASNALVRTREQQALRELEIAAAMQDDLLPLPNPPAQPGWRAVARRRSARAVAGDYADVFAAPDGGLLLAMVDVMGKGMPAALFAGVVRTALRIHVDIGRPLERLIHDLNRVLCRQTGELTLFATCALVHVLPGREKARIVNAGHCPVLWLGSGVGEPAREFAPSGPPLGLYPEIEYKVEEQALAPGDSLVLVTDGLYEWETGGPAEGNGGWPALVALARARRGQGGEALWDALQQRIRAAAPEDSDPRDDQTMLYWERRA